MSTGSLSDDLTSPSPSPPPRPVPPTRRPGRPKKPPKKPPPPKKEKGEPMPKAPGVEIAMDSGSELSELTEDDDGAHANQRRLSQEGSVDDDDEQGEQDDHDDDANNLDDDDSLPRDAKRKVKPRARNKKPPSKARPAASSTSSGSNGTIKRKRSSIIPPTMWGWVAPGTGTTSAVEEEEEEDAQPRAMEEESASDQDIKERDDTEEADEPANGMDVDEPMLAAPIESAAAATLLDLLAVASPELINGAADQNTESEDDDGEDEIDVQDAPVVTVETLASVKRIARRASAARPPPVDDRPVSPISQDGDEPDGPSRQVSPVSERSADDEQDKSDIEVDAPDKSDPEEEPENEAKSDNDEQVEMELQPAHRAEALDVLAGIELKYALLRQAIYLDRMEGLGWEEALVQAGTHPEMLHLQRELMARRDRRIELATRKRSFECVDAGRKRSAAEHGVWTWWKLARDDLQTDMITETNTKRRKMERDRRGTERPLPSRRIPSAPPPHAPPPPPDLRRILKGEAPLAPTEQQTSRIRTRSQRSAEPRPNENAPPALVFPDIACLSAADIANDLSHILRQSQPPPPPPLGWDCRRHKHLRKLKRLLLGSRCTNRDIRALTIPWHPSISKRPRSSNNNNQLDLVPARALDEPTTILKPHHRITSSTTYTLHRVHLNLAMEVLILLDAGQTALQGDGLNQTTGLAAKRE
ncbi:Sds3-like-domain-containing protein [Mycena amicta]|nr:Sds3-like-domain-containing protein [Mycena amicta]